MELVFGIILAALGLRLAFKLLVWAFVVLRIISQLCDYPHRWGDYLVALGQYVDRYRHRSYNSPIHCN